MATYEENVQWMQTLSPEKRSLIQNIANLGVMRSNARNTSSRLGQQRSEISFKQAGGEAAYQNLISQLKTDPQLYQEWKGRAQRTGGLGQGMTELSMLAAFAALPMSGLATAQTAATIPGQTALNSLIAAGVPTSTISTIASSQGVAGLEAAAANLASGSTAAGISGLGNIAGQEMMSANEILSLKGNPTAFEAAKNAGLIPQGVTMGADGAILTSSGAELAGASTLGGSGLSSLISGIPSGAGSVLNNVLGNSNTLGNIASGLAGLYGSKVASDSASQAAEIQARATQNALDETKRQFDIGRSDQMPWMTGGKTALNAQLDLMGLGQNGASGQLSALTSSPGYQFRLGEGIKSLDRSASARGNVFSGAAGKALSRYGQDYASNEYGNRLAQLSSLSGQGQSAAAGQAALGQNYAGNVSNLLTSGANAQGAAAIARGAANQSGILGVGQSISNIFNPPKTQPTLSDLLRGGNYGY